MEELSVKEKALLRLIEENYSNTGFTLSLAEAALIMNMSKGSVIADIFKRLEAAGVIVYSSNRKQYKPSRWRELIAGQDVEALENEAAKEIERLLGEMSKRYDAGYISGVEAEKERAEAEIERRVKESRAFLDKEYKNKLVEALAESEAARLAQERAANAERIRKWREKTGGKAKGRK